MTRNRPLLLGHRGDGVSSPFPENTISSFDACLTNGCDGFEFDVRLNGSGEPVVCHSPEIAGISVAAASTHELSYLPKLQDIVAQYAERAFLDIELKVPGMESAVLTALREHLPIYGCVVSSFLPSVLNELRLRSQSVPLGLICKDSHELALWQNIPAEYIILHHSLVTCELLRKISDAGKISLIWTVNDPEAMLQFADWDVDGIISDETALMVQTFSEFLSPVKLHTRSAKA